MQADHNLNEFQINYYFSIPSQKLHRRFNHRLKLARFEGLKPSRGFEKHARDVTSSSKSDLFLSSSANYRSRNKSQSVLTSLHVMISVACITQKITRAQIPLSNPLSDIHTLFKYRYDHLCSNRKKDMFIQSFLDFKVRSIKDITSKGDIERDVVKCIKRGRRQG